eukprot:Gb_26087 [translate_table: standard]
MPALADPSYNLLLLKPSSREGAAIVSNMTALPSPGTAASGTSGSLHGPSSLHIQTMPGFSSNSSPRTSSPHPVSSSINNKRKRRPAGTPDPDAEVVALSPKTLMESDRYVCEICNQGFQRDQNLQMHRRRHKVPWKLLKRPTPEVRKRVYVCPDPTCLHNDPCHALGDLVGIKKHFRRKHSIDKQWKCEKCSKGYAVQSDYKAHLKTCGTRGHSCDCGRVFSRVESFIEHQDNCNAAKERATFGYSDQPSLPSLTVRNSSSNDTLSATRSGLSTAGRPYECANKFNNEHVWLLEHRHQQQRELQLLPSKHPSDNFQAAGSNFIRDIRTMAADPSSNPAATSSGAIETRFQLHSTVGETESAPTLQLSIGLYADPPQETTYDRKPAMSLSSYAKTDFSAINQRRPSSPEARTTHRVLGLALSSNNSFNNNAAMNDVFSSSKPADYEQRLMHDTGSSASAIAENGSFRAANDIGNTKLLKESGLSETLWPPGQIIRQDRTRDEGIIMERPSLKPWNKSLRRQISPSPTESARLGKDEHSRYNNISIDMAPAANAETGQTRPVERTELVNAWSDIAAARLAKEQAQQEREEAQNDMAGAELLKLQAREHLRHAAAEKAYAEHARDLAKRQIELAEAEFATAKRIQEHAQAQLTKAQLLKEQATRRVDATRLEITCQACRQQFQYHIPSSTPMAASWPDHNSNAILMSPTASNFHRIAAAFENDVKKEA